VPVIALRAVLDVGGDFNPDDLAREALHETLASADTMNAQLDIDLGSVVPDRCCALTSDSSG